MSAALSIMFCIITHSQSCMLLLDINMLIHSKSCRFMPSLIHSKSTYPCALCRYVVIIKVLQSMYICQHLSLILLRQYREYNHGTTQSASNACKHFLSPFLKSGYWRLVAHLCPGCGKTTAEALHMVDRRVLREAQFSSSHAPFSYPGCTWPHFLAIFDIWMAVSTRGDA